MKVLVCGATGCIGSAVVRALRSRGHRVVPAARQVGPGGWAIDFMQPRSPQAWAALLREAAIDAVVNCVGILIPGRSQSFERLHAQGPIELFGGAALAGVSRVVQVSALGAGEGTSAYHASKRTADEAVLALPLQAAVLRPSLVYGPGSDSGALFATLAALPVVSLPGGGRQLLQPIHVYEVAEIAVRCLERRVPASGVFDIGGAVPLTYRDMLAAYRQALGLPDPLWLPLPMAAMQLAARAAEALPQRVFSRDTLSMLQQGCAPAHNAAAALLGREPTALADGLRISPPQPALDLRVTLSPAMARVLRAALGTMWLWTAAVSALQPQASGLLPLLARCGFEGTAGWAMLVASCTLNAALGLAVWLRPAPLVHALQAAAIAGYTVTAAWHMPELTLDHCGALVKNLPLLAAVLVLWMNGSAATARRPAGSGSSLRPRPSPPAARPAA